MMPATAIKLWRPHLVTCAIGAGSVLKTFGSMKAVMQLYRVAGIIQQPLRAAALCRSADSVAAAESLCQGHVAGDVSSRCRAQSFVPARYDLSAIGRRIHVPMHATFSQELFVTEPERCECLQTLWISNPTGNPPCALLPPL
jgi:hypothetical protein